MMDVKIFEELRTVLTQQNQTGEFPSWLMDEIMGIIDNAEQYKNKKLLIETLTSQIGNFDLYAGAGCFDTGVSAEAIQSTLRQLNLEKEGGQCELIPCCNFFADKFRHMPKTETYIKKRLCFGDYLSCNRFKIYVDFGKENLPPDLDPTDAEEVKKVIQCLRNKKRSNQL